MSQPDERQDERGTVKPDGRVSDRRRPEPWVRTLLSLLAVIVLVLLAAVAVSAILALHNTGEVDTANNKAQTAKDKASSVDRELQRSQVFQARVDHATAYRLCSRTNVTRAAVQYDHRHDHAYVRFLQSEGGAPILDCSPNLHGEGASLLPRGRQVSFVRRWRAGQLNGIELGVCPHSVFGEARKCR